MAKAFLGGHQEVGANSSECEEHKSAAKQEDSLGPVPNDRQLYEPKVGIHI